MPIRSSMAAPIGSNVGQTQTQSSSKTQSQSDLESVQRFHYIVDSLIGEKQYRKRGDAFVPRSGIPQLPRTKEELAVMAVYDSCAFKTVISAVGGFVLGGVLGLFSASVDPHSTMGTETPTTRMVLQQMKTKTVSMGKDFAIFGAGFGTALCAVESYRGKTDIYNSVISGAILGGAYGFRVGLKSGVISAAGFALFSAVIDHFVQDM